MKKRGLVPSTEWPLTTFVLKLDSAGSDLSHLTAKIWLMWFDYAFLDDFSKVIVLVEVSHWFHILIKAQESAEQYCQYTLSYAVANHHSFQSSMRLFHCKGSCAPQPLYTQRTWSEIFWKLSELVKKQWHTRIQFATVWALRPIPH